jgi:adenylate cyclase
MVARHALNSVPDADIVIVDIDERSLSLMADSVGRWPWPRSLHAELVEGIERQRPKALVFDILFSDADLARPEGDQYFADVIRANSNLYFPMLLLNGPRLNGANQPSGIPLAQYGATLGITAGPVANPKARASFVLPLPVMVESGRIGVHNAVADNDGVVRGYPLYLEAEGWQVPSLPARVATGLGYTLPAGNQIRLNWHGKALSFQRVSYADVYSDLQRKRPQRSAHEFSNKIVIIGATANGLHDVRATPIDSFYVGVEILATAIDNLKNANPLRGVPPAVPAVFGLFLLAMLALALTHAPHLLRIGAALALASAASLLAAYFALEWRWLLLLLTPLIFVWAYYLIAALMEYMRERKARELAIKTFGRFLDPRVVQALITRGETMQSLSGKSCEISMLFSDIRGFTSLSETSTPEQVVELLNRYFTQQVAAVFAQEGTLDKYIGDAIMAFWGAPAPQPDHALRAVAAALDMSDRLEQFRHQEGLGYGLEIGIGVHSGPAVVGFIGSENRQDYTAIGDTVNLASRIEGQTKGVARVLVSGDTRRMCEAQAGAGVCPFEFIDKGEFQVKGRAQMVRLFEPIRAKA